MCVCFMMYELKSLDVALNIAGVENYSWETYGCGHPRGHLIRVLNERNFSEGGSFCVCYLQMQTLCRAVAISITTSYSTSVKSFIEV